MIALALLAATACQPYRPVPVALPATAPYLTADRHVRVVGYNDMAEMLAALGAAFTARHPAIRFDFILKSTRSGPPALIDATSAFAPMGAELTGADLAAWRATNAAAPVVVRIAGDSLDPRALSSPLGIFVNAANPLRRMTMAQVRVAFTRPGALHPTGLAPDTALALFMRNHVLHAPYAPNYSGLAKSRQVIDAIAADPQVVGFADLSHADPRVRLLRLRDDRGRWHDGSARDLASGTYPLDRHLLLVFGPETPIAFAFARFALSCEGQAIVGRGTLGYRPLHPVVLRGEQRSPATRSH